MEIDEALVGKKHGMQPHGNNNKTMKIWVVGMAEREGVTCKRMRMKCVQKRNKTRMRQIIKNYVDKESVVFTDG